MTDLEPKATHLPDVTLGETMVAPPTVGPPLPSVTPPMTRIAGRYEILNLLGEGGMGTVYRARDTELDELVALKVLRRELVESPAMLARFRQEAKLARRVTHRNVARTFDIGEHEGEKFLTMELVDGESRASSAARRGRLPLQEVLHIVHEVCAGMSAAHAADVIHRDLKPDNVLVGKDGRIVVTDFGIAHAAAGAVGAQKTVGGIVGTPAYMAPEQVEAATDIDARADLYALGAMMYELLTGERPWPGDAPFAVASARLVKPPPDPRAVIPGLPAAVADVVLRCMAKDRAHRFESAEALALAFGEAVPRPGTMDVTPQSAMSPVPTVRPPARARVTDAAPHTIGFDRTIAVLPFKNGGPPEDEYLADGLTDDLIDLLSMTRGLKVRPRGAVAHLAGDRGDPRRTGAELGVQVVVEGSVRRTPTSIRVSARLLSTSDGFQIWAKRFDRPAADMLVVNDEAAHAIAEALTVESRASARVAPTNPAAVDLYLRATHEYRRFWREAAVEAVALYEEALALAPHDATILAACARARVRVAFFGGEGAKEMLALARAAADRAVAGAPEAGTSWVALASARMMEGDSPGAARAVRTALDRTQGLAPAHDLIGRLLAEVGRPNDAISHLRTSLSIDPTDFMVAFELARVYALVGRWDESQALLDAEAENRAADASRFVFRMRQCFWRGKVHPDIENAPAFGPYAGIMATPTELKDILTTRELSEEARQRLVARVAAADPRSRRQILFSQLNTEIFAYTFEVDHAMDALLTTVNAGLQDILWMDRCPLLEPLRKDARFLPLRGEVEARVRPVLAALDGA